MTQEKLSELAAENMKTIFAYALSRVSSKDDAEDLAGDIILAILQNGTKIKDDNAFFGYIWAIAANTYKKFLRKKSHMQYQLLDEELTDGEDFTLEILKSRDFHILRRELALLSREYRECTVAYYFDGLSCAETASRLHISLEMVKYYLFKTRKILKEGISMEREFGTKSYNPAPFEFCTIFSGTFDRQYQNLFDRKLPGNILVSTYYTPMTIRELSIELGVASAYLEDEIALLERYHLLTPLPGGKYQARLVIFTEEYLNEFRRAAEQNFTGEVGNLISRIKKDLPAIRSLHFPGEDLSDDHLVWSILFELMRSGWRQFLSALGKDGESCEIYPGAEGISYGSTCPTDYSCEYSTYSFAGCQPIDTHYAASYADFGILPQKNRPSGHFEELAQNLSAVSSGTAQAIAPVVSREQKQLLHSVLEKECDQLARLFHAFYDCSLAILKIHAPESMAPLLKNVVSNCLLFDTAGLIAVLAVRSGALSVPDTDMPLGVLLYEEVRS